MRRTKIIAGVLLAALVASSALAGGQSSARSVAMGGAHLGLARGVEAGRYNPANLGLTGYNRSGLEIVGVGANVANNSFTLSDYNRYSGAFLTDQDKADILDKIPVEGLKLSADVEATALSTAIGAFAFNVTGVGLADVNMSRDIFELVFNGNTYADTIDVTGSYSDAVSYVSAGLSYGHSLYRSGSRELAVGATAKYLRGVAMERVTELEGMMATYATGFAGEGHMVARTATGGSGYALDLGASLRLNNDYIAGVAIQNFISRLSWNRETQEHGYNFSFDTMTVANMGDDYIVSDDYSVDIPSFSTNLPSTMTFGLANTTGKFVWAIDYLQGFRQAAGASKNPRLAFGAEWTGLPVVPLRAGYATGGGKNSSFSFGSGLSFSVYYLDLAVVTGSSFSGYSSKGLNFAVSTGLHF
ncbi:MAG: DUF5723 family protein [Candidatus Zixiibacteriota bacterium]